MIKIIQIRPQELHELFSFQLHMNETMRKGPNTNLSPNLNLNPCKHVYTNGVIMIWRVGEHVQMFIKLCSYTFCLQVLDSPVFLVFYFGIPCLHQQAL